MNITIPDEMTPPGRRARRPQALVAIAIVTVGALVAATLVGCRMVGPVTPSDTSPEAGFARDMQTHHNRAVQMALNVRVKATDPALEAVTYDIVTSQQQQSGQMYAWLTMWRLTQTSAQPPMTWAATNPLHNMGVLHG